MFFCQKIYFDQNQHSSWIQAYFDAFSPLEEKGQEEVSGKQYLLSQHVWEWKDPFLYVEETFYFLLFQHIK